MGNNNKDPTDDIVSRSGVKLVNITQRNIYDTAITCNFKKKTYYKISINKLIRVS